jgi:predicted nucleic acid-binding protein
MSRFADTYYYLAVLNPRDATHQRAITMSRQLRGPVVTTEFILLELADGMARPPARQALVRLCNALRADPLVEIVPASNILLDRGLALYAARPDKEWSLTDCISFVVMQDRGIAEALTGDHHFEQTGFVALLK